MIFKEDRFCVDISGMFKHLACQEGMIGFGIQYTGTRHLVKAGKSRMGQLPVGASIDKI